MKKFLTLILAFSFFSQATVDAGQIPVEKRCWYPGMAYAQGLPSSDFAKSVMEMFYHLFGQPDCGVSQAFAQVLKASEVKGSLRAPDKERIAVPGDSALGLIYENEGLTAEQRFVRAGIAFCINYLWISSGAWKGLLGKVVADRTYGPTELVEALKNLSDLAVEACKHPNFRDSRGNLFGQLLAADEVYLFGVFLTQMNLLVGQAGQIDFDPKIASLRDALEGAVEVAAGPRLGNNVLGFV